MAPPDPSSASRSPPAGDEGAAGGDAHSITSVDSAGTFTSHKQASLLRRLFRKSSDPGRTEPGPREGGGALSKFQEKLVTKILKQIVPEDHAPDPEPHERTGTSIDRPGFNLLLMSNNFMRFNERIGAVFVLQNRILRLLVWKNTTQSLTLLAAYTFVCLNPSLIPTLPFVLCIIFVMVPAFMDRHSPDAAEFEMTSPTEYLNGLSGPPLAPATKVKPVAEMSKEFFRNLGDLQNVMDDYSRAHDLVAENVAPPLMFQNETVSSVIFISMLGAAVVSYFTAHFLPWKVIFLVGGWVVIAAGSPHVQEAVEAISQIVVSIIKHDPSEPVDRPGVSEPEPVSEASIANAVSDRFGLIADRKKLLDLATSFAYADIDLSGGPEKRLVEIFELQYRPLHASYLLQKSQSTQFYSPSEESVSSGHSARHSGKSGRRRRHSPSRRRQNRRYSNVISPGAPDQGVSIDEGSDPLPYEHFTYSTNPFFPFSPARASGNMPKGARNFDDVQPPKGWEWAGSKWTLDPHSNEWAQDRCASNIEVEIGGGRWVWDVLSTDMIANRVALAQPLDGTSIPDRPGEVSRGGGGSVSDETSESLAVSADPGRSGELALAGPVRGEWRRRRWVRWAQRKCVVESSTEKAGAEEATGGEATVTSEGLKREDRGHKERRRARRTGGSQALDLYGPD